MDSALKTMIIIYICLINIIGLVIMGLDKSKAKKQQYRIPEKTFFIVSIIGGSVGTWIGMMLFRHKTKHWYFLVFIPLIFFAQVLLIFLLIDKGIL